MCGNSLGLQPKKVKEMIDIELSDWQNLGVEGHVHAQNPWLYYHHNFSEKAARIVGAKPEEVAMMNTLTVNLHLMMVSFFRPNKKRFKVLVEGQLFPSDHYAIESQLKFHGFDPEESIIEINPEEGEHIIRHNKIIEHIEKNADSLCLVLLGGVNYYTGQLFDMEAITKAGHHAGALVGFDLAHAAGNIPLHLHDWHVDFAVWCTYKYLNSGPGSVGGVFIHEKHLTDQSLHRFAGWWGYQEESRFDMKKGFVPIPEAAGWQCSNAQIFNMVAHKASLDLFDDAGMERIRAKSLLLTGYLEYIIGEVVKKTGYELKIITPAKPQERGAQLSILTGEDGQSIFEKLKSGGVIADWRKPNVIRLAPAPLYNSFEDIFRIGEILCS